MHDGEIVGRDEEHQAISSFLASGAAARVLVIDGGRDIVTTTTWSWDLSPVFQQ